MPRGVPKAGKRAAGAGRPLTGPAPLKRRNLWLSDEQMARLRALGGDNASEGVRRLLAAHFAPEWPESAAAS